MSMSADLEFRSTVYGGFRRRPKTIYDADQWLIKSIFMVFGFLQICGGLPITNHHLNHKRLRSRESFSTEGHDVVVVG